VSRPADTKEGATGLPLEALTNSILTLRADGKTCAFDSIAVYVGVNPQTPAQVVRVDLMAELRGIKSHIASAFLPSGFRGPVFIASGFMADCWHLYAAATDRRVVVKAAMQSCECASGGPGVQVPAVLQEFPIDSSPLTEQAAAPMISPPLAPFGVN
jgi:hypothetical protein